MKDVFGQPFKGPIIPFGSLVEYHPITAKDQSRIHQFGKKVLSGLFLGYALYAGGIWKGDVLIADLDNGQKPHLIKDGIRIICNTENFVPIVVPGLSSSSSGSSSILRTSMKQESHSSSSSSSSPSPPTVGEIQVREREDAPNSDISPVPVSNLVDDGSGKPEEIQANKTPKTNRKEATIERRVTC